MSKKSANLADQKAKTIKRNKLERCKQNDLFNAEKLANVTKHYTNQFDSDSKKSVDSVSFQVFTIFEISNFLNEFKLEIGLFVPMYWCFA